MKYRIVPILIVVFFIVIGHVIKWIRMVHYKKRADFTTEFNNKFFEMVNKLFDTGRLDQELYAYCIHDVDKIQQELGNDGIIAEFVDPLKGVKGYNYQLFMNIMPEIRSMISFDNSVYDMRVDQLLGVCDDALKRHIGNLDRAIDDTSKGLFNPFSCFGEGIRWLLGLPFDILLWCGIIGSNGNQILKTNSFFKLISNIIVFIGLIGSIMTIVLGWNEFIGMVQKFL